MIIPSSSFASFSSVKKPVAGGGGSDVTPNAVNWNDSTSVSPYTTNTQTITGISTSINIQISWFLEGPISTTQFKMYVNDIETDLYAGGTPQNVIWSNNDVIYFTCVGSAGDMSVTIINTSDNNTVLDTIYILYPGCFLTHAVVQYMNLFDDGPELTAMRSLREYYKDVHGYQEIIQEYYTNSQVIIDAINESADPSVEYNYIYNTVIAVMNHVNAEEWQQAHDLYMAMYNDLKKRYLG
jgi:hypothetical protein